MIWGYHYFWKHPFWNGMKFVFGTCQSKTTLFFFHSYSEEVWSPWAPVIVASFLKVSVRLESIPIEQQWPSGGFHVKVVDIPRSLHSIPRYTYSSIFNFNFSSFDWCFCSCGTSQQRVLWFELIWYFDPWDSWIPMEKTCRKSRTVSVKRKNLPCSLDNIDISEYPLQLGHNFVVQLKTNKDTKVFGSIGLDSDLRSWEVCNQRTRVIIQVPWLDRRIFTFLNGIIEATWICWIVWCVFYFSGHGASLAGWYYYIVLFSDQCYSVK